MWIGISRSATKRRVSKLIETADGVPIDVSNVVAGGVALEALDLDAGFLRQSSHGRLAGTRPVRALRSAGACGRGARTKPDRTGLLRRRQRASRTTSSGERRRACRAAQRHRSARKRSECETAQTPTPMQTPMAVISRRSPGLRSCRRPPEISSVSRSSAMNTNPPAATSEKASRLPREALQLVRADEGEHGDEDLRREERVEPLAQPAVRLEGEQIGALRPARAARSTDPR